MAFLPMWWVCMQPRLLGINDLTDSLCRLCRTGGATTSQILLVLYSCLSQMYLLNFFLVLAPNTVHRLVMANNWFILQ